MDPVTTLTFGSSSLVPWPNQLSLVPDARSSPRTRLGAFTQSVLPGVVTARLPSLPSKVLPDRFADAAPASPRIPTANTAIGITIVLIETRRRARCLDMDKLPEWAVPNHIPISQTGSIPNHGHHDKQRKKYHRQTLPTDL